MPWVPNSTVVGLCSPVQLLLVFQLPGSLSLLLQQQLLLLPLLKLCLSLQLQLAFLLFSCFSLGLYLLLLSALTCCLLLPLKQLMLPHIFCGLLFFLSLSHCLKLLLPQLPFGFPANTRQLSVLWISLGRAEGTMPTTLQATHLQHLSQ